MGQGLAVRNWARLSAALVACALVAGCGKAQLSPMMATVGTLAQASVAQVKAKRAQATATAPKAVSRAEIEAYNTPILRAVIELRAADVFLTLSDTKGSVQTWTTTDGTTFSLRDGVLIQTRGLGPDLLSADAPTVAQLLQNGATYPRRYFFLGADDQVSRRTYDCTVTVIGRTTITVVERDHAVTHVREDCARPQGSISSEYWIEGAKVRRSVQSTSGLAGLILFERVVD
ncbi:MAG: hypothetical protein B7Z10_06240 [Rhodobacterales bacterium 32-66-7]|nr:MAG: hypothetical protein B7Z31_09330 [Rhodobacterales bacterium 12-65-15]OYX25470.1 MAG: hypothetical protein B7Z10_06240 [Rhodobacterales bacterium 32-66-7]